MQRYAIVLLDTDILLGSISIHNIDHLNRNAFFGIIIGEEEYRGKGYGSEAIRLILNYGLNTLNLHNIMLSVHADDYPDIACYKKGFREAGRCRDWVFKNGMYVDKIYMDILEHEFDEQCKSKRGVIMGAFFKEAIRIAHLAGNKIKDLREKKLYTESVKDGYELLTTADLESNEIIKTEICKLFPTHNIISEEDTIKEAISIENPTWIIDPIDGTVGYANDHYQVAVSIAFAMENTVKIGVVYNPFLEETFYAVDGLGAFLNDKTIKVKDVSDLRQCVIGTGFPHKRENIKGVILQLENILPNIRDIRRLGSPALDICWVACGRMQGFYEEKLHPWDVAAAKFIAIQAGAKSGYYKAGEDLGIPDCINGNNVLISSPDIFDNFLRVLNGI